MFKIAFGTSLKKIIVFLLLSLSVFTIMKTVTIPMIVEQANGLEVFDLRPMGYSIDEARLFIESLTSEGKFIYTKIQLPLDFIYPVLLALFSVDTISYLKRWIYVPKWIFYVPVFACVFDYLENISIYLMLRENCSDYIIWIGSFFTISKSIMTTISLTAILILTVISIYRYRKGSNENGTM